MEEYLIITPESQQSFAKGMDLLDRSVSELRKVADSLMPVTPVETALGAMLKSLCSELSATGATKFDYQSNATTGHKLRNNMDIAIYGIVRNILTMVQAHTGAQRVLVELISEGQHLKIIIYCSSVDFDRLGTDTSNDVFWKDIIAAADQVNGTISILPSPAGGSSLLLDFDIAV